MWRKRLRVWRDSRSMPRPSICLPWRARAAGAAASVERQQGPFRQARGPCHCLRFTRAKATASETRAGMVAASVVQQSKQCFLFQIFVIWSFPWFVLESLGLLLFDPSASKLRMHCMTPSLPPPLRVEDQILSLIRNVRIQMRSTCHRLNNAEQRMLQILKLPLMMTLNR
ncbi:uncharacterized protein [Penaeus vannamei]|uniref:uncharacterized protein isoform X2 n=1 Tax=Penaeus vannamei TaxID=6689 RepID=UPI00387F8AFB